MKWPWQHRSVEPPPTAEQVRAAIARLTRRSDEVMIAVADLQRQREELTQ